jgi:hypothetical protein
MSDVWSLIFVHMDAHDVASTRRTCKDANHAITPLRICLTRHLALRNVLRAYPDMNHVLYGSVRYGDVSVTDLLQNIVTPMGPDIFVINIFLCDSPAGRAIVASAIAMCEHYLEETFSSCSSCVSPTPRNVMDAFVLSRPW